MEGLITKEGLFDHIELINEPSSQDYSFYIDDDTRKVIRGSSNSKLASLLAGETGYWFFQPENISVNLSTKYSIPETLSGGKSIYVSGMHSPSIQISGKFIDSYTKEEMECFEILLKEIFENDLLNNRQVMRAKHLSSTVRDANLRIDLNDYTGRINIKTFSMSKQLGLGNFVSFSLSGVLTDIVIKHTNIESLQRSNFTTLQTLANSLATTNITSDSVTDVEGSIL